jgi:AcrR family transcriptional regulator
MNLNATSKANILKTSREIIQQNGWAGVNIRSVAAACGVSVGCIYNYFASKTELLSATVESIWSDIFHHPENEVVFQDTLSCVRWMYQQLEDGCQRYPGFFTHHALGFVRQDTADGKQQMQRAWRHILEALCVVLQNDTKIRADAFTEEFTVEKFAEILFSLMLSALVRQDFDPSSGEPSTKNIPQNCGLFFRTKVNGVQYGRCCRTEASCSHKSPLPKNQSEKGAKTYACNH